MLINAQYSEGGPIIAVQVENEYGSYAKDEEYMPFIKEVRNTVTGILISSSQIILLHVCFLCPAVLYSPAILTVAVFREDFVVLPP